MTRTYNPRDNHDRPLATIGFADGAKWVIRFPKAADRHLLADIGRRQRARLEAFRTQLKEWEQELHDKATAAVEATGDKDAGERSIEEAEPPVENPEDLTVEYWHAEVLAAFISPEVSPEDVLDRLGNEYDIDFLYERHAELMDTLEGSAAKKRVRGSGR